jgi:hypothetical protein
VVRGQPPIAYNGCDLRFAITVCAALAVAVGISCSPRLASYPVPTQRPAPETPAATPATQFITMVARDADDFIAEGVFARRGRDPYRWTGPRVRLQFKIREQRPLRLVVHLAVPEVGFQVTGPVAIHFLVDGMDLGTLACPRPGSYRFEKEVPPEWTAGAGSVVVTAIADPGFYSASDRCRYGFLLFDAGLFTR